MTISQIAIGRVDFADALCAAPRVLVVAISTTVITIIRPGALATPRRAKTGDPMPPRLKKLLALFILLPGLVVYLFAAAALGERVPDHQALKVVYYIAAGVAWALPVRFLIMWANAENGPDQDSGA
jgi:hypothetical protein